MFITFLLLICALSLSTVAAYYSVVGLATIFAGAFWPVIIMGALLEASKIVLSSWLYRNWIKVPLLLKTYLTSAVIVLMIITSIGIFGFLSKAHVEQTSQMQENLAIIERYDNEISRNKKSIERAEQKLKQLENVGTGSDVNIQNQIDVEQKRIDEVYKRVQPLIDEQNKIIDSQSKIITDQINEIDRQQDQLQKYIDAKEIAKAQGLVGTKADGEFGPGTAAAVKQWQQSKKEEKITLVNKLEDINKNNAAVKSAREEITKIRQSAENQVQESNRLINRLREQVGKTKVEDISSLLTEQQDIIKKSNQEIESISAKKFTLESSYRKLEAEVGPIKYLANFIYNTEADKTILEKSVTWMILVIIFVFDPLAILMLIAANLGLVKATKNTPPKDEPLSKNNENVSDSTSTVGNIATVQVQDIQLNLSDSTQIPEQVSNATVQNISVDQTYVQKNLDEFYTIDSSDTSFIKKDLTENAVVLQSTIDATQQEDKTLMQDTPDNSPAQIKLNADEIIQRISKNKPVQRYDAYREYYGYKH
jgi:peptidoglycan hydrolase-like protein with peptidoglycan-binding domain